MGKITKAFKEAKAVFKTTLERQKEFAEYKKNLDTLMNAIALVPTGVNIEDLKDYVRSEIKCYEYHVGTYERRDELDRIGQPIPTSGVTVEFDDDGSITVAEEIE